MADLEKMNELIQKETAYPNSVSVQQALLKVWNECEQQKVVNKNDLLPDVNEHSLFELRKRAEKVADLIELMNDAFPKYPRENIITACMACIQDAYKTGHEDALNAR